MADQNVRDQRTVFFISDGTGITVETFGLSLLSQFPGVEVTRVLIPFVNSTAAAHEAVARINKSAAIDGARPIVFSTLVQAKLRSILATSEGLYMELFSQLDLLSAELNMRPTETMGKSHGIKNPEEYKIRIDAVQFALDNDDGARTRHYDQADIILIGVSRSGKTPTSLYLALQFGIRAANYPLTEEDLEYTHLPKCLEEHKRKLFGLTINPERLAAIRNERKANSRYSSLKQCEFEVREVEILFNRLNIPFLDSTELSVEEISTRILSASNLQRRIN